MFAHGTVRAWRKRAYKSLRSAMVHPARCGISGSAASTRPRSSCETSPNRRSSRKATKKSRIGRSVASDFRSLRRSCSVTMKRATASESLIFSASAMASEPVAERRTLARPASKRSKRASSLWNSSAISAELGDETCGVRAGVGAEAAVFPREAAAASSVLMFCAVKALNRSTNPGIRAKAKSRSRARAMKAATMASKVCPIGQRSASTKDPSFRVSVSPAASRSGRLETRRPNRACPSLVSAPPGSGTAGRSPLSRGAGPAIRTLGGANRLIRRRFSSKLPAGTLWCRKRDSNPRPPHYE